MHPRLSGLVELSGLFLYNTFSIWEGILCPPWPQIFLRLECGLVDKGVSWRGHTNGVYLSELSWHTSKTQASPQLRYTANAVEDLKRRIALKPHGNEYPADINYLTCYVYVSLVPPHPPFKCRQNAHSRNVVNLFNC